MLYKGNLLRQWGDSDDDDDDNDDDDSNDDSDDDDNDDDNDNDDCYDLYDHLHSVRSYYSMLNKDNNWNNKIIPEDITSYFSRELTLYGNNTIIIISTIIINKVITLFITISIIILIILGSDIPITYAWNLASLLRLHSKVFGKSNIRVIRWRFQRIYLLLFVFLNYLM